MIPSRRSSGRRTRHRVAVLLAAALAWSVTTIAPAVADDHCETTGSTRNFNTRCKEEQQPTGGATQDPNDLGPVFRPALVEVDGEECWSVEYAGEGPGGRTWDEAWEDAANLGDNGVAWARCPADEGPDIRTLWLEQLCPPPAPTPVELDPDNAAITGKAGYLTIGGNRTVEITCLGQVITAEARYVVHWGDGETTETTSQGGQYPDGDLTHIYQDKGDYTLVVEAYWTGDVNGTQLPELPVPTTAEQPIDVTEVQAVVTEQH